MSSSKSKPAKALAPKPAIGQSDQLPDKGKQWGAASRKLSDVGSKTRPSAPVKSKTNNKPQPMKFDEWERKNKAALQHGSFPMTEAMEALSRYEARQSAVELDVHGYDVDCYHAGRPDNGGRDELTAPWWTRRPHGVNSDRKSGLFTRLYSMNDDTAEPVFQVITSHINSQQDRKQLRAVDKRTQQSADLSLVQKLNIKLVHNNGELDQQSINLLLKKIADKNRNRRSLSACYPQLESMSINSTPAEAERASYMTTLTQETVNITGTTSKLKTLNLNCPQFSLPIASSISKQFTGLCTLNLHADISDPATISHLGKLPHLNTVNIHPESNVPPAAISALGQLRQVKHMSMPAIRRFGIPGKYLAGKGIFETNTTKNFVETALALGNLKQLSSIDLSFLEEFTSLPDQHHPLLALADTTGLQTISISTGQTQDDPLDTLLSKIPSTLTCLSHLALNISAPVNKAEPCTYITNQAMSHLLEKPSITSLAVNCWLVSASIVANPCITKLVVHEVRSKLIGKPANSVASLSTVLGCLPSLTRAKLPLTLHKSDATDDIRLAQVASLFSGCNKGMELLLTVSCGKSTVIHRATALGALLDGLTTAPVKVRTLEIEDSRGMEVTKKQLQQIGNSNAFSDLDTLAAKLQNDVHILDATEFCQTICLPSFTNLKVLKLHSNAPYAFQTQLQWQAEPYVNLSQQLQRRTSVRKFALSWLDAVKVDAINKQSTRMFGRERIFELYHA